MPLIGRLQSIGVGRRLVCGWPARGRFGRHSFWRRLDLLLRQQPARSPAPDRTPDAARAHTRCRTAACVGPKEYTRHSPQKSWPHCPADGRSAASNWCLRAVLVHGGPASVGGVGVDGHGRSAGGSFGPCTRTILHVTRRPRVEPSCFDPGNGPDRAVRPAAVAGRPGPQSRRIRCPDQRARTCSPPATPAPTMAELWSPEHKIVLERRAVDRGARGPARPRASTCRDEVIEAYREGRRPGRPRLDRRPGAGHPPRREGPHRGVLRPRRPRAHPQGHDLAGPHRERRAAAGPPRAGARPGPDGRGAGPAGRAGRRARRPGHHRPQPQRRRPRPPPSASASPTPARSCCRRSTGSTTSSPATRCGASRARSAPSRTSSTCSTATSSGSTSSSGASPRHLGFDAVLTNVGPGVPPLARPRRRVRAGAGRGRARRAWPLTIRLMAGQELVTEGFQPGPGRLVGHAPQDEHPLAASASTASTSSCAATSRWSAGAGRRPVERGRRVAARSCAGWPCPTPSSPPTACSRRFLAVLDEFGAYPAVDRARARALPALPRHHQGAHGRGAGRRRARGGPRGHQGARGRRRPGAMREQGAEGNDLLDRLAADPRLGPRPRTRSTGLLADPLDFVGAAPRQVGGVRRPGRAHRRQPPRGRRLPPGAHPLTCRAQPQSRPDPQRHAPKEHQ